MKLVNIPGIGDVQIVKNPRSRSIKMTIDRNSTVKVTIPSWAPYKAGEFFLLSKQEWIKDNLKPKTVLNHGDPIGKFHHLYFKPDEKVKTISSRKKGSELWVTHPYHLKHTQTEVQDSARKISMSALRVQAQNTLPQRLGNLAEKHELSHTKAMHHGPEFWKIFDQALPNAKSYRKQLHNYAPYI